MRIVLDTNTLVRFFTNDIPQKVDKVEKLLKKEKNIFIPDVVFPELEYILLRQYNSSRKDIIEGYNFLLSQKNLFISQEVRKAVVMYEETKLDMADCIIA